MQYTHVVASMALALTLGLLTGCGATGLQSAVDSSQSSDAMAMRLGSGRGMGHFGKGPGMGPMMGRHAQAPGGEFGLFAGLTLTAEQRAQLAAIAEQYRPKPATGSAEPRLGELLVAETLDVEALRTELANRPTPPTGHRLDFLVAARGVLTDAQRTALIERLKAAPAPTQTRPQPERPPHGPMDFGAERLTGELALTTEQQAAYEALKTKLAAAMPTPPAPPEPAAIRTALIAFLETGDVSGLQALEPEVAPPAFPADEFVAWVQGLSFEQRKALFARPFGPHHGPHGRF